MPGSTRPRQVTDWSSEIGQATSTQDLGDAGSAFGCTRMQFDTLDSQFAKGVMQIMNSEVKRRVQVAKEAQEKRQRSRCCWKTSLS